MKSILILIVLTFISCYPANTTYIEEIKKLRKERREKILSCINEKGSPNFKKLFNDNINLKIGKIMRENKDSISEIDKKVFHECRKQALKVFRLKRKTLFGSNKRSRRNNNRHRFPINK